jgi:hypothetical protein
MSCGNSGFTGGRAFGGAFGEAPVDIRQGGLSKDPLKSGAAGS